MPEKKQLVPARRKQQLKLQRRFLKIQKQNWHLAYEFMAGAALVGATAAALYASITKGKDPITVALGLAIVLLIWLARMVIGRTRDNIELQMDDINDELSELEAEREQKERGPREERLP